VDTLGWLLLVWVSTAAGQDRAGARTLWARWRHQFSRLALIWADGGDAGKLVPRVWGLRRWRKIRLEIVPRLGGNRLVVLPKRWIGERTIGWWMKWRRLRGDYEQRTDQSEAFIYIAMIGRMTRRLARKKKNSKTRSEAFLRVGEAGAELFGRQPVVAQHFRLRPALGQQAQNKLTPTAACL